MDADNCDAAVTVSVGDEDHEDVGDDESDDETGAVSVCCR
jgi:hypothetical protein